MFTTVETARRGVKIVTVQTHRHPVMGRMEDVLEVVKRDGERRIVQNVCSSI